MQDCLPAAMREIAQDIDDFKIQVLLYVTGLIELYFWTEPRDDDRHHLYAQIRAGYPRAADRTSSTTGRIGTLTVHDILHENERR
jgi:hypothetical protein